MCAIRPAVLAPPVPWYLTSVLIVQAASSAVSGFPSDHFAFGRVWNVQVRPSFEVLPLRREVGRELQVLVVLDEERDRCT